MSIGIITGASSGFGKEFSKRIKKYYPNINELWIIARSEEKLIKLKDEIKDEFVNIEVIIFDITTEAFFDYFKNKLEQNKPSIEVVINNAGVGYIGEFKELPIDEQIKTIELNINALLKITHLVIPYMNKNSHIIQIGSAGGFIPQPGYAVYSASKNFVYFISKALRKELKKDHIYLTIATPGPSDTSFYDVSSKYNEVPKYKLKNIIKKEKIVNKILKDSLKNKKVSIYGIKMKSLYFISKLLPYDFLMLFIK